jgi:hypothetical protein
MIVRRAVVGDEPILRALRLQALSDAPDAFGSTYERELGRTIWDWRRWLSPGVTFILEGPQGDSGIVAGSRDAGDPNERNGFRLTGRENVRERDGEIEVQMERAVD